MKLHRTIRRLALSALLFALGGAGVRSSAAEPPLRALFPDTEPFGYRNEAGELVGAYVQLARTLAERAGLAVQPDIAPVARVVHEINGGTADFTLLLPYNFNSDVREVSAAMSLEVWLLPRTGVELARPQDVTGLRVVGFKGTPTQLSLPAGVAIHWQDASSARTMVAMVKAGRADVALGVREALISGLRSAGLRGDASEGFGPPLSVGQMQVSLWVRPGLPQPTIDALARALKSLQQDGGLARVQQQYFGDSRLPLAERAQPRR